MTLRFQDHQVIIDALDALRSWRSMCRKMKIKLRLFVQNLLTLQELCWSYFIWKCNRGLLFFEARCIHDIGGQQVWHDAVSKYSSNKTLNIQLKWTLFILDHTYFTYFTSQLDLQYIRGLWLTLFSVKILIIAGLSAAVAVECDRHTHRGEPNVAHIMKAYTYIHCKGVRCPPIFSLSNLINVGWL